MTHKIHNFNCRPRLFPDGGAKIVKVTRLAGEGGIAMAGELKRKSDQPLATRLTQASSEQ